MSIFKLLHEFPKWELWDPIFIKIRRPDRERPDGQNRNSFRGKLCCYMAYLVKLVISCIAFLFSRASQYLCQIFGQCIKTSFTEDLSCLRELCTWMPDVCAGSTGVFPCLSSVQVSVNLTPFLAFSVSPTSGITSAFYHTEKQFSSL